MTMSSPMTSGGAVSPNKMAPAGGLVEKLSTLLPKQPFLNAAQAKGMDLSGTFSRKQGVIYMHLQFSNKAMAPMSDFAIQFNKNSYVDNQ